MLNPGVGKAPSHQKMKLNEVIYVIPEKFRLLAISPVVFWERIKMSKGIWFSSHSTNFVKSFSLNKLNATSTEQQ